MSPKHEENTHNLKQGKKKIIIYLLIFTLHPIHHNSMNTVSECSLLFVVCRSVVCWKHCRLIIGRSNNSVARCGYCEGSSARRCQTWDASLDSGASSWSGGQIFPRTTCKWISQHVRVRQWISLLEFCGLSSRQSSSPNFPARGQ